MPAITQISYQRNKQHLGGCNLGMKTQEELNALKEDVETVSKKLYVIVISVFLGNRCPKSIKKIIS